MNTGSKRARGKRKQAPDLMAAFRKEVWKHYKQAGRHNLPWRKKHDAYRVLVSEMMLQQTQVPRVIAKFQEFLKEFPTVYVLSHASLAEVVKAWSGLGYNRRAKYLHDAAKVIVSKYEGSIKDATAAGKLPGIGVYTRAAVRIFAFNEPHTLIETNVRAAFLHHFFPEIDEVPDKALVPLIERAAAEQDPREWHWALMDYGSHLKKLHKNPTRRSAHYVMQSKFVGSMRQIRGAILKLLTSGEHGDLAIAQKLAFDELSIRHALHDMAKDGLVTSEKGSWRIA